MVGMMKLCLILAPPRLPSYRPIVTDIGEDVLRLAWRPAETYQAKRTPPVSYRLEAKELPGKTLFQPFPYIDAF